MTRPWPDQAAEIAKLTPGCAVVFFCDELGGKVDYGIYQGRSFFGKMKIDARGSYKTKSRLSTLVAVFPYATRAAEFVDREFGVPGVARCRKGASCGT